MSSENLQSLIESFDAQPQVDNRAVFEQLRALQNELRAMLDARFVLQPDASTRAFEQYSSLDGAWGGSLNGFTDDEIDWLIHSWIGNPQTSFSNLLLTAWFKSHTDAPHLGIALVTTPAVFVYLDYIPRRDLFTHLDYLDRYYTPLNEQFVAARANPNLAPFISKSVYMRQALSPAAICYTCEPTRENMQFTRDLARTHVARWIEIVNAAQPLPESERASLAQRDLVIRRAIAERDPANTLGARLFGDEMAEKLVRGLWGGERIA